MELSINEKKEIIDFLKEFTDYGEVEKRIVVESCGNEVNLSESSIKEIAVLEGKFADVIKGFKLSLYDANASKVNAEIEKLIKQCKELEEKFKASGKSAIEFADKRLFAEGIAAQLKKEGRNKTNSFMIGLLKTLLTLFLITVAIQIISSILLTAVSIGPALQVKIINILDAGGVVGVIGNMAMNGIRGIQRVALKQNKNVNEAEETSTEENEVKKLSKMSAIWNAIKAAITGSLLFKKLNLNSNDIQEAMDNLDDVKKLADEIENYKDEDGNGITSEKSIASKVKDKLKGLFNLNNKLKNIKEAKVESVKEAEKETKSLKDKIKGLFKKDDKNKKEVVEAAIEKAFYESFIF